MTNKDCWFILGYRELCGNVIIRDTRTINKGIILHWLDAGAIIMRVDTGHVYKVRFDRLCYSTPKPVLPEHNSFRARDD